MSVYYRGNGRARSATINTEVRYVELTTDGPTLEDLVALVDGTTVERLREGEHLFIVRNERGHELLAVGYHHNELAYRWSVRRGPTVSRAWIQDRRRYAIAIQLDAQTRIDIVDEQHLAALIGHTPKP